MKTTPSRMISTGVLALALVAAVTAGSAAASTVPTEPIDTTAGNSAPPGEMAPGCAEIVGLLNIQNDLANAYLSEDGETLATLLGSLPAMGEAAQATAPADIAGAVAAWVVPLGELQGALAGVDLADFEAVTATLSSVLSDDVSAAAQTDVEVWATDNCGWVADFADPFADAPEPQECEILDPAVAAEAAGIEVDVTDTDGSSNISLPGYWQKSCSYGNGAITISTISFNDIGDTTQFFADNLVDAEGNPGEFIVVDLGGLPESTLVTSVGGLTSVSVLEATIPFAVGIPGDDVDPATVVAAAVALYATLPAEAPPPPTTEPMTDGTVAATTTG